MYESSVIEISRTALVNNLRFLKLRTGSGVKFCSVVKGNAYGHGLTEYISLAMECNQHYFGVYSADEAYKIVEYFEKPPEIYIMGMVDNSAVEWAVRNRIECCIFDMQRLELAVKYAKKHKTKAKIHIELETGMHRTGFEKKDIEKIAAWIKKHTKYIELVGVCTHFAGAESMANNFRIINQIENFNHQLLHISEMGLNPAYKHAACSAAFINYPETIGNMVRIGIMQYGYWPNEETFIRFNGQKERNSKYLKRLITWKSKVMSVKFVQKGEFIGYGTSYLAHRNMKIAVVPVGYAHGYSRNLSNNGHVLVKGIKVKVVGIVNMNAISIDVTNIDDIEKGEEVVLIGTQKNKSVSVVSFSELSNQMNYEMLTRLPKDIPRVIVE